MKMILILKLYILHSIPLENLAMFFCQKKVDVGFHFLTVNEFDLLATIH